MKIKKEVIGMPAGRSFKLFSPTMRQYFYWHFHPEIELVFVEATSGIRHVGQHISTYVGTDLVLIGPNIPHLNFDYGLQTEYKQIVVQCKPDFLQGLIAPTAEFAAIRSLLERSHKGLAFHGKTKKDVVARLRQLRDQDSFDALLGLLDIFQMLAASTEVEILNHDDTTAKWLLNDKLRMGTVYDYVGEQYDKTPDVNVIAARVHLSTAAFCRYFKRQTHMTFTDFVNQYRVGQAKDLLLQGKSAAEACYLVGYESASYFNKVFKAFTGQTPAAFKTAHQNRGENTPG